MHAVGDATGAACQPRKIVTKFGVDPLHTEGFAFVRLGV
jgi:hypothetical protein